MRTVCSHRPAALTVVLAVFLSAGCFFSGDLLEVDVPDLVDAEEIESPAYANLLVSSAIADFECAFTNYVAAAGLLGDELADGDTDPRLSYYDRRSVDSAGTPVYATATCRDANPGIYQTLQTARFAADNAVRLLQSEAFVAANLPDRKLLLATAAAYSGYSYVLLAEVMCTAAIDGGPRVTSDSLLQMAEQRFTLAIDTAISVGTGAAEIVPFARLGRARARLDRGQRPEALADARLVPTGFRRDASYSALSERSSNRIWRMNNRNVRITIEEDFRNVLHMGVPDPRITVVDGGRALSIPGIRLWLQGKYSGPGSPMPIARSTEAQLIIAEVEGGQTAVDIINGLHAAAGLPPFATADPETILRHIVEERRLELFLESHHFFDKLRFNALLEPDPLPDTPPPGADFPTSGHYGATKCLPLPDVERLNNPNIP